VNKRSSLMASRIERPTSKGQSSQTDNTETKRFRFHSLSTQSLMALM